MRWEAIKEDAKACTQCQHDLSDAYRELSNCEIRAIEVEHGSWWKNEYVIAGLVILAFGGGFVIGKDFK